MASFHVCETYFIKQFVVNKIVISLFLGGGIPAIRGEAAELHHWYIRIHQRTRVLAATHGAQSELEKICLSRTRQYRNVSQGVLEAAGAHTVAGSSEKQGNDAPHWQDIFSNGFDLPHFLEGGMIKSIVGGKPYFLSLVNIRSLEKRAIRQDIDEQ